MTDDNEYVKLSRIRSVRRRKRMQIEDFDKELIRFHKEENAIGKQIRNLGWIELKPPIQRGFIRYFILRDDVRRTKQALFFEKILEKINTEQWSCRKDFKRKRKRFGKKVYVVREQKLRDIEEGEFSGSKFNEQERAYFYETLTHSRQSKKPIKVYRFTEQWRFVLRVQLNMITKVRIKDLDLERKRAEIDKYFDVHRRHRLWKLLHGACWRWSSRSKDKYKDPFRNRSFADVLNEYLPEPTLRISYINPRRPGGFSFIRIFWVLFSPVFPKSCREIVGYTNVKYGVVLIGENVDPCGRLHG